MSNKIYTEKLMQEFKSSPHKGTLNENNFECEETNLTCKDSVKITAFVEDEIFKKIMFKSAGCILSQVAASFLCKTVLNKNIKFCLQITEEDFAKEIKIQVGPNRLECLLLPLNSLKNKLSNKQK